jgi:hypothetical protein
MKFVGEHREKSNIKKIAWKNARIKYPN